MTRTRLASRTATDTSVTRRNVPGGRARLVATRIDASTPALVTAVQAALAAEGLPNSDLTEADRAFYAYMTDRSTLAGFAGLQLAGEHALIRSVVVLPGHRGRGLVLQIVPHMVSCARNLGATHAWLLTDNARPLFERLGFTAVDTDVVPAALARTSTYRTLRTRKAVPMMMVLV